jgi:hypothetical protein
MLSANGGLIGVQFLKRVEGLMHSFRSLVFAGVFIGGSAYSQTVAVNPTDASPDNVTRFNSLMMALHSFQITGVVAASTDVAGVGVNFNNPAADVINVAASGRIDEVVRIDERLSCPERCVLTNPLVIQGPGAGLAAPGAAQNAVVELRDDSTFDDDGFEIRTDSNITFVPSRVAPPGDDLVTVDRVSQGGPNTVSFRSCVFTTYDNSGTGVPVVQSKAEALTDRRAFIGSPVGSVDDLFVVATDSGEAVNVELRDCVISHTTQDSSPGMHDGIVEMSAQRNLPGDLRLDIRNCVVTRCQRYGVQFGGSGNDSVPGRWLCAISGDSVGGGPVAGLGGPTVLAFNQRALHSFLSAKGCLTVSNVIAANSDRQLNLNRDTVTTVSDSILVGPVPFSTEFEAGSPTTTWERISWRSGGSPPLLGANLSSNATLILRDCVMAGPGGACLGTFGAGDMYCSVESSACVLSGPDACTSLGGTSRTTFAATVITSDPQFAGSDPLAPDCLDVRNCLFSGKASTGSFLKGGADFSGTCATVSGWQRY